MHHMQAGGCRCPHHVGFGLLVMLFGLTFLLQAAGVFSAEVVAYIWPSILILAGLLKVIGGLCSCCKGKMMSLGSCGGSCAGACGEQQGGQDACCADDQAGECCQMEDTKSKS